MPVSYELDIAAEIEYARKWVYIGNPDFYDFSAIWGDCTNFVSQCLYAGGAAMNYTPDVGWYYISLNDRAAAWTGVEFFCSFMLANKSIGPYGELVRLYESRPGDVVQLGADSGFYHSLLVTDVRGRSIYVAARSYNVFDAPLSSYVYKYARCIHIIGSRSYR